MENLIMAGVLLLVVGLAVWYVVRARKKGRKCIGCPDGGCSGTCSGCAEVCTVCSGSCKGCSAKREAESAD